MTSPPSEVNTAEVSFLTPELDTIKMVSPPSEVFHDIFSSTEDTVIMEKNFNCNICGRGFNYKSNLTAHKVVHTGEKNFKCDLCGKGFPRNKNLTAHMVVHTGEKNFKCDICQKEFPRKSSLTAHMVVHTGEKKNLSVNYVGKNLVDIQV